VGKKKKKKQERFAAGRGAESRLRSFLAHPVVADVLAAGLIALANALRENRMIRQTVSKVKDKAEVVAGESLMSPPKRVPKRRSSARSSPPRLRSRRVGSAPSISVPTQEAAKAKTATAAAATRDPAALFKG
jgi:hypothetical protein